jgi:hypothetical protein
VVTPSYETMSRVLDQVRVALSDELRERIGGLGEDPLLVFEVLDDEQTRICIGERPRMLQALLRDRIIDQTAAFFLEHAAPRGFVWLVIDWGDEVTTLLHSADAPDRRAS